MLGILLLGKLGQQEPCCHLSPIKDRTSTTNNLNGLGATERNIIANKYDIIVHTKTLSDTNDDVVLPPESTR